MIKQRNQRRAAGGSNRVQQRSLRLVSLLIAAALAFAGCGSSGESRDAASGFANDGGAETTSETRSSGDSDRAEGNDAESGMTDAGEVDGTHASGEEGAGVRNDLESPASMTPSGGGFFGDEVAPESDRTGDNVFDDAAIRRFISTADDTLSTFALDVDTASYALAEQWVDDGQRPPEASVRVEEYVNAFTYDYPSPNSGLTVVADGGPSPFSDDSVVLRLGIQAEEVSKRARPDASLTFVVDTSGSMDRDDRLGLVKTALVGLVDELDRGDTVAIVTYSSGADVLLSPTSASNADEIIEAIERLRPNGSTNLEAGLMQGYALANESFVRGGINRVILASDGVANVGLTDPDGLVELIRDDADEGIQLVTVGVGMGNFNDHVMETLADDGDGFYAYVNSDEQAERLFTDDLVSSLLTVAIDAKVQVDFDPAVVEAYRLIGYENRAVLDQDFRNDAVDAGELNAGHQVTALYEVRLHDGVASLGGRDRLGTVALRWEDPEDHDVVETRLEVSGSSIEERWSQTAEDYRLAVTVAAFAEVLRGSPFATGIDLDEVLAEADALRGADQLDNNQVAGFADLVAEVTRLR